MAALAPQVPRSCQCMLMSATSSAEVDRLTALVLHNPLTLNLLGQATGEVRCVSVLRCGSVRCAVLCCAALRLGCAALEPCSLSPRLQAVVGNITRATQQQSAL